MLLLLLSKSSGQSGEGRRLVLLPLRGSLFWLSEDVGAEVVASYSASGGPLDWQAPARRHLLATRKPGGDKARVNTNALRKCRLCLFCLNGQFYRFHTAIISLGIITCQYPRYSTFDPLCK